MNLLLDANFALAYLPLLQQAGHEVDAVAFWPDSPEDPEILRRAWKSKQVVLTTDRGFGKLAVVNRQPHCGIVVSQQLPPRVMFERLRAALEDHRELLETGGLVVITKLRTRARPQHK